MNLHISSEQIANPPLANLLRRLSALFARMDREFFVIGATARDIILQVLVGTLPRRKTRDLDIAIAVTDWQNYDEIKRSLIAGGFKKAGDSAQRFFYDVYELDLVPFGGVADEDDNIYWPPDETVAMSVKSFGEVMASAVTVCVDDEFEIKVASLHGLFLLKLNAWLDRNISFNKDAEDLWYIIDNYYFANEARLIHPEVYELNGFTLSLGGAYWLAHDVADLLDRDRLMFYRDALVCEMARAEDSRLLTQILETHPHLTSADVMTALHTVMEVFTMRLSDK